jgi:hypothetical protein
MMFKKGGVNVMALVGNHDLTGSKSSTANSMMAHSADVVVIDKPTVYGGVLFMPYMADTEEFVRICTRYATDNALGTLVCHQTFDGSKYDTGFYAKDGIDPKRIPFNRVVSGHIHCFDLGTEVLTDSGWKFRECLDTRDRVVGIDLKDGSLKYQIINEIIDGSPQPMVSVLSKQVDLLVTGGHELLVRPSRHGSRRMGDFEKIRADSKDGRFLNVPISADMDRPGVSVSDDFLRLIVWLAADGNIEPGACRWHLKKYRKIERLTSLLDRLGACFSSHIQKKTGNTKIRLTGSIYDELISWFDPSSKSLPFSLRGANKHQASILLEEYEHTDGHRNHNQIQIGTAKKQEADLLQEIFVTNGIACSIAPKKGSPNFWYLKCIPGKLFSQIYLLRNRHISSSCGPVWCLRVDLGTIMVRRNGKVSVTGNCPQSFGNVLYVGSPRWRILSDANKERAIWMFEFDEHGSIVKETPFSTNGVCRMVHHLPDREGAQVPLPLDPKDRWHIDVYGTPEYVETRKKDFLGSGARVRPFPDQKSDLNQVRESEGIEKSFMKYSSQFQGKFGTPSEVLREMAQKRLGL